MKGVRFYAVVFVIGLACILLYNGAFEWAIGMLVVSCYMVAIL